MGGDQCQTYGLYYSQGRAAIDARDGKKRRSGVMGAAGDRFLGFKIGVCINGRGCFIFIYYLHSC